MLSSLQNKTHYSRHAITLLNVARRDDHAE